MKYDLRIAADWDNQITKIRNGISDETRLIRFDNSFYRICRNEPSKFTISLWPNEGGSIPVRLTFKMSDLYVTHINDVPFERYASTIDLAPSLYSAIYKVHHTQGKELFESQSVVVFYVAESLRNDHISTAIAQSFRARFANLRGVSQKPDILSLLPIARNWGQTSDAIFESLSSQAKDETLKPNATQKNDFFEKVMPATLGSQISNYAKGVKVLKRPSMIEA